MANTQHAPETQSALQPQSSETAAKDKSDFFTSLHGQIRRNFWRKYWKILRVLDAIWDARIVRAKRHCERAASTLRPQNILLVAVKVSGREADLDAAMDAISKTSRHAVTIHTVAMEPMGKYDNINRAIAPYNLADYDWLLVIDDDIEVPVNFLDPFLYLADRYQLKLAMPAHKFRSHSTFAITERHWATIARRTGYVECGPVTLFHRSTFQYLTPFPNCRWAWGLDTYWAHLARKNSWDIGVVDVVPIRHLRPVGKTYDGREAIRQAEAFLDERGVTLKRKDMFGLNQSVSRDPTR